MTVPTTLADDRYELLGELGVGTTSTVYRAFDRREERECAIKVLAAGMSVHETMRRRFLREATMTAQLSHANMAQVHDTGEADGQLFIVMELILGGTLQQVVELRGPIPARHAASILQQVLHALHYAHAKGVVHRDVNPGNIMLTLDGTPKVVDFGIGRAVGRDARHTTDPGSVLGTWGYMAPEQGIDAGGVDYRTDIYAAGATLYAILSGIRPGRIATAPDAEELWDDVPGPLRPVILRAMAYQPDERYQTAAEMAQALADAHDLLPALTPEEEATIVLRPVASDDTVMRKQVNLSNLVPPGEAKAERKRIRARAREERKKEDAPTVSMEPVLVPTPAAPRAFLDRFSPAQVFIGGVVGVLAIGLLASWLV